MRETQPGRHLNHFRGPEKWDAHGCSTWFQFFHKLLLCCTVEGLLFHFVVLILWHMEMAHLGWRSWSNGPFLDSPKNHALNDLRTQGALKKPHLVFTQRFHCTSNLKSHAFVQLDTGASRCPIWHRMGISMENLGNSPHFTNTENNLRVLYPRDGWLHLYFLPIYLYVM